MARQKNIKRYVIGEIAKRRRGLRRRDVDKLIWIAQGFPEENHTVRTGYYGQNLRDWRYNGLITIDDNGRYKATKLGRMYANEPEKFKIHILRKQMLFYREKYRSEKYTPRTVEVSHKEGNPINTVWARTMFSGDRLDVLSSVERRVIVNSLKLGVRLINGSMR